MKRTAYAVPATGATVTVVATQPSRMVEIVEDGENPQGLVFYFAQDNFLQGYNYRPVLEPVVLGNKVAHGKGKGPWVGLPVQKDQSGNVVLRPATILFKVSSATGTATQIDVTEYD